MALFVSFCLAIIEMESKVKIMISEDILVESLITYVQAIKII